MPAPDAPPRRPWQQDRWPDSTGWDNHGGHISAKAQAAHDEAAKAESSEWGASAMSASDWAKEGQDGAGKTDATVKEEAGEEAKVVDSKLAADLAKAQAGLAKAQAEGKTTVSYWSAKVWAAKAAIGSETQEAKGPPISWTEKKGINAQYDAAKAAYDKNPTPANADALAKTGAASLAANAKWAAQEKANASSSSYTPKEAFTGSTGARALTSAEKSAIQAYQGSGYHSINSYLRTPGTHSGNKAYAEKHIGSLDSAIGSRNGSSKSETVHRGMSMSQANLEKWVSKAVPGSVITDPGYTSTSRGKGFNGNIKLDITLPAGTKAFDMNAENPNNGYKNEQELLLGRGAGFKIDSITQIKPAGPHSPAEYKVVATFVGYKK